MDITALADWLDTPLGHEADRIQCEKAATALRQLSKDLITERSLVKEMEEALDNLIVDSENRWHDPHTLAEARAALASLQKDKT